MFAAWSATRPTPVTALSAYNGASVLIIIIIIIINDIYIVQICMMPLMHWVHSYVLNSIESSIYFWTYSA